MNQLTGLIAPGPSGAATNTGPSMFCPTTGRVLSVSAYCSKFSTTLLRNKRKHVCHIDEKIRLMVISDKKMAYDLTPWSTIGKGQAKLMNVACHLLARNMIQRFSVWNPMIKGQK